MSVAGLDGPGIELTGLASPGGSSSAVLPPQQQQQQPARQEAPHLRFEIEDVEEQHATSDPQHSVSNTGGAGDLSVTTFGYNTAEAVPMTVYYRNTSEAEGQARPSLDYLRQNQTKSRPGEEPSGMPEEMEAVDEPSSSSVSRGKRWQFWKRTGSKKPKQPKKFGWIMGVLLRCVLNIWGVMLFIRLSWVVGQAGIGLASVVVLLSMVVTIITTISMSAICTNGEVKGGGAYYLISRSLGPEFGGAIGIIFSLANAVAVSLYVVGFAETVTDLMKEADLETAFTGVRINDIRVIGIILVTLLLGIALIGLDWEAKIQIVLLFILLIAIINFIIGTFIPRSVGSEDQLRGFTGYSGRTFVDNFVPGFRVFEGETQDFFTVFAVFFPAATGILAGANISGDLKNPQTAIPKGTFLAIFITSAVYLLMAWLAGVLVIRDAPGGPADFLGGNGLLPNMTNGTIDPLTPVFINTTMTGSICDENVYNFSASFPSCRCDEGYCVTVECLYGNMTTAELARLCEPGFLALAGNISCDFALLNSFQVMEMISGFGPLVTAGIFAATLSSALTSLISAPKVFQRVCQDKMFPLLYFFAKGGGRSGTEPVRAYILAYFIAVACISIGSLNEIAKIISNFFLMAYALINYSCFAASFSQSPGWRPAFKLYNRWVALLGAAVCVAIMFVIRWYFALITIVLVIILYQIVNFLKPDINWGSTTQAFLYSFSMRNLLKLEKLEDHVKNFRPQFLVLTGAPSSRPDLSHFVAHISKEVGVMICGQVLVGDISTNRRSLLGQNQQQRKWLRNEKIKAFHNIVMARTLRDGAQSLLQLSGLGKLRPNTIILGFKSNWTKCSHDEVEEYVAMLHDAYDLNFGVVIFRLRAGFDATERMDENAEVGVQRGSGEGRPTPQDSPTPPPPVQTTSLRLRAALHRSSEAVQPLLGGTTTSSSSHYSSGFTEIPLSSISSTNPAHLVEASPSRSQGYYQPITHGDGTTGGTGESDSASIDSYTLAMEGGGRLVMEEEEEEEEEGRVGSELAAANEAVPDIITMPSRFETPQGRGYIDVWWLYDDGGLAILLPYLLSQSKHWKNCKLRIFTAGSSRNIDQARLRMTSLLRKFRINFSVVIEVTGVNRKPSQESLDKYHQLPQDPADNEDSKTLDKMTLRHIRLGELLQEHSSEAKLIVITSSVPQRSLSALRYMSWLETMSRDLPPILMMRGNQTSVLTFYS